ncbi:MAG TPA: TRAM domain-containing protein [Acidimicrobiales bacterium]|nr:TRAM domain-containing protein [Acidimicrobiales bacterium]
MFVEIVRLFIVFFATAAGYRIGLGSGAVTDSAGAVVGSNGAVVGATLGACIGYVSGGVAGRLLRRWLGAVEEQLDKAPAYEMVAGVLGGMAVGGGCTLIGMPIVFIVPGWWGWPVLGLVVWCGMYLGYTVASRKAADLLALAGLSTRPLVRATPFGQGDVEATLLDTSAIIDGRLLALVRAGFLRGALLVPGFVLAELQSLADAPSGSKRTAGRKGLDVLGALQSSEGVEVHVLDDTVPEADDVDAKLVALARRLDVGLCTVDQPLQQIAELQGVRCLNLHKLSETLRPAYNPGEVVRLTIAKPGREPGQGVGFADDGTMVVVGDAETLVGQEVDVRIMSNVRTSVGPMLFAKVE